ncbi:MAG TPA: hypothetical protein VGO45_13010 [Bacteroidia bacterium]|jgi:hypothetical protein|nr:hypothetical protein [Bacteroidia bacterium]
MNPTGLQPEQGMKEINPKQTNRLLQLLYLASALALLQPLRYYLDCNDTLQYLVIAGKYAAGDVSGAINSYWGPLLSWLLVPFIRLGSEAFFVLKGLQILIGLAVLTFSFRLLDRFNAPFAILLIFKLACLPLILSFALLNGTPDLLMLCWLLLLALLFSDPLRFPPSLRFAFVCGITGALLYFTKTSGLVFFFLLYAVHHIYLLFFRREFKRSRIALSFLCGIGVCLLFASPWILALSRKYGQFTVSSSGAYNFAIIGPAVNPDVYGELNHPFFMGRLYEIPRTGSLNAWEDPMLSSPPAWSPLHSKAEFSHYLRVIWKNIRSLQSCNFGKDTGTLFVLGWIILLLIEKRKAFSFFRDHLLLLLFPLVLSAFYVLIIVMHRYLWINDMVILLLSADLARRIWLHHKAGAYLFSGLFLALILWQSGKDLHASFGDGKANWEAAGALAGLQGHNIRVASLESDREYSYDYSSLVCYRNHLPYLGLLDSRKTKEVNATLNAFGVTCIFTWDKAPDPVLLTNGHAKEWISVPEAGLHIFTYP